MLESRLRREKLSRRACPAIVLTAADSEGEKGGNAPDLPGQDILSGNRGHFMLVIRKEQMNVLRGASDSALVPEMLAHVRAYFPDKTANQDDTALTVQVKGAIKQARRYSLHTKRDLFRFVNLTMMYGLDWEASEDRRWMHDCLVDPSGGNPNQRLKRVFRRCLYQLAGESNADAST
jgi:hypothetical protein